MGFGPELINAQDPERVSDARILNGLVRDNSDVRIANINTFMLQQMIDILHGAGGGYILIPPGRYFLGRNRGSDGVSKESWADAETRANILVERTVTLRFMPGAVLVLMSGIPNIRESTRTNLDARIFRGSWSTTPPSTPVSMAVQGHIEAGIHQIFDVFHDAVYTEADVEHPSPPTGPVIFSRQNVRQIYPEWWGAIPASQDAGRTLNGVRRTTRALQACFDAAHRTLAIVKQGPDTSTPSHLEYTPIPVVLSDDYMIDDELVLGVSAEELLDGTFASDSSISFGGGLVIRGNRGPSSSAEGNVRLIASPTSQRFAREPLGGASDLPGGTASVEIPGRHEKFPDYGFLSMLAVRGPVGFSVENITFDANGIAPRCVTLAANAMHHIGFQGCSFLHAKSVLVHCGAELEGTSSERAQRPFVVTAKNPPTTGFWNGGLDLSGLRFVQCDFKTTTHATADGGRLSATGVYVYAGATLGIQFRGCTFRGPGNPMIHMINGRLSFDQCYFKTEMIQNAFVRSFPDVPKGGVGRRRSENTNGLDLFFDLGPQVAVDSGPPALVYGPACVTARDVLSESAQFASSFAHDAGAAARTSQSATVFRGVVHRPPAGTDLPSVFWDGVGETMCPLLLVGCDLPARSDFRGPVYVTQHAIGPVFDLGNTVRNGIELFEFDPAIMRLSRIFKVG